jgi:hypothetical protein
MMAFASAAAREERSFATAVTSIKRSAAQSLCSPIDGKAVVFGILRRAALVTNVEPTFRSAGHA